MDIKTKRGLRWHVETSGEGDAVLLIHGFGGSGRWWEAQKEFLRTRYQVVTIDLPGHGESGWMPLSLSEQACDAREILNALSISHLTMVASSFGGLVGLELYRLIPEKVARMSLVGVVPKFARSPQYPAGLDMERIRTLSRQFDGDYASMLEIFFRSLLTMKERLGKRLEWIKKMRQQEPIPQRDALKFFLDILETADLRDCLKSVTCPLQFITGGQDYICPRPVMDWLCQQMPHARFDFMEGFGHLPFLTDPVVYNRLLEDFLLHAADKDTTSIQ